MTRSTHGLSHWDSTSFGVGSDFRNLRARADKDVVGDAIWFNATGHHHIPPETRWLSAVRDEALIIWASLSQGDSTALKQLEIQSTAAFLPSSQTMSVQDPDHLR